MKLQCLTLLGMALLIAGSGCSLFDENNQVDVWSPIANVAGNGSGKKEKKGEEKIEYGQPVRMAIVWTDSVYTSAGAPPTRGFGGRIYFYDKRNKPVRADGKLVIYAYNDSDNENKSQADRRYEYERADFQKHYSESDLGHSYSVWVPWDGVGGKRLSVALIPMFKTPAGQLVRGGQDIVVLPGTSDDDDEELMGLKEKMQVNRVRISKEKFSTINVSHQTTEPADRSVRTTTINMPRQMSQRLASLPATTANPSPSSNRQVQQHLPQSQLPPGIHPSMIEKLQQKNSGLPNGRITYAGYNSTITSPTSPPNAGESATSEMVPEQSSRIMTSAKKSSKLPAGRPVFGSPGARK